MIKHRAKRRVILSDTRGFATVRASLVSRGEEGSAVLTEGVRVNPGAGMCFVEVFLKGSEVRLCLSADATMSKQKRTLPRVGRDCTGTAMAMGMESPFLSTRRCFSHAAGSGCGWLRILRNTI